MKKQKNNLLMYILIAIISIICFRFSYAKFSSSASNNNNQFSASSTFPTATPTNTPIPTPTPTPIIAQTLVINEILPHSSCSQGGTEGQFVELWNGTNGTVDLKNYKLTDGTNIIAIANSQTNLSSHFFAILVKSSGLIGKNKCIEDIHGAVQVNLGGQVNFNTGNLQLLDASNPPVVIDTVQWTLTPTPTPPINQSYERNPTGQDSATGTGFNASDFVVKNPSTPGQ